MKTIRVNGAEGEGGGQVLRSSLTLSMCSGVPVEVYNIRARRSKPGLLRQHLTCVRAAAAVSDADVSGDELGAKKVLFVPGKVRAGEYRFAIGTAGSTSLVLQTVLPALCLCDAQSVVTLEGGTHNPMAPSLDFLSHAFFPVLRRMGVSIDASLSRYGFYPAGGGRWSVTIRPGKELRALEIIDRGTPLQQQAVALLVNLPAGIGTRELGIIRRRLGWEERQLKLVSASNSPGQGNALSVILAYQHLTEVITVYGKKGLSAEKVASRAVKDTRQYLASSAPVGEYLADQLLVPMALAGGGRFRTSEPSSHTLTNIEVIEKILGVSFQVQSAADGSCLISL